MIGVKATHSKVCEDPDDRGILVGVGAVPGFIGEDGGEGGERMEGARDQVG